MSIDQAPPRNRPLTGDARRWAAARDEYLAGSPAEAVCRRHDLRLATFRRRALREGWRRMDQPEAEPLSRPEQNEPLVIPEAPQAPSGTPLTAAQMVERCWSHIQTAVAAGRVIEARNWMRLYKDLKPFARYEEIAAREARMDREAADRRAAEAAAAEASAGDRLVIPEAPEAPSDDQNVALPLHCFSAPESHEPLVLDDGPPGDAEDGPDAAGPSPATDLLRLATRLAAVAQQVEQAVHDEAVRLPLHCFSPEESHAPPAPLNQAMRDLQTEILALKDLKPLSDALPGAP